ncbi:cystatin family protein [Nocardia sp. NPDC046473]|uniref:cystatin family protein n=1 Tax=Nocardia sp. NPDC046473 TaxID=3155733 RepID=UPI0033CECB57
MTAHRLRLGSIPLIVAGVAIAVGTGTTHAEPSTAGGWSAADPESREVATATAFAVSDINIRSNAPHYSKLIRIVDAQRQINAGVRYRIVFDMAETFCRKTETVNTNCAVDPQGRQDRCTARVWVQPWQNFTRLQDFECQARWPNSSADANAA